MYIKYTNEYGRPEIREIYTLSIVGCKPTRPDSKDEAGAAFVDINLDNASKFADHCIEFLAFLSAPDLMETVLRLYPGERVGTKLPVTKNKYITRVEDFFGNENSEFCYVQSYEIAELALNAICEAMAQGKHFLDLTNFQLMGWDE